MESKLNKYSWNFYVPNTSKYQSKTDGDKVKTTISCTAHTVDDARLKIINSLAKIVIARQYYEGNIGTHVNKGHYLQKEDFAYFFSGIIRTAEK